MREISISGANEFIIEALERMFNEARDGIDPEIVVKPNGYGPTLLLRFTLEGTESKMRELGDEPSLLVSYRE